MSFDYALYCWRLYRKQLLATPALMLVGAFFAGRSHGESGFVGSMIALGFMAPMFAGINGALGSRVLAPPWSECDEVLPLSASRRAGAMLGMILAFAAVEVGLAYAVGAVFLRDRLAQMSSYLALAGEIALWIGAVIVMAAAFAVAGSLALFSFAGTLQRNPQQGGLGVLVSFGGFVHGVLWPLGLGCGYVWSHPATRWTLLWPVPLLLAAAYALPLLYIRRASYLVWLEPGKWRRRGELGAIAATLGLLIFAAHGFRDETRARLKSWPELTAPYWGRIYEKGNGVAIDRAALPGGTLVGIGEGDLYWLADDGRRTLIKTRPPAGTFVGVDLGSQPKASFMAAGSLWVLFGAAINEPQSLWAGPVGQPLKRVRGLPPDPEVRVVFEDSSGSAEVLGRAKSGRWFRSPLGEEGDPLAWTRTPLSVSTSAADTQPMQRLVGGATARWIDEGSAMTLEVADSSGTKRFEFTSGQLRTVGGGKPQPYALRYDGRFVWVVLAARAMAKAEAEGGVTRLVEQWELPDSGLMHMKGYRVFRPGEDGLFVNTMRGIELIGWDGRRTVLVSGGN